MVLASYLKLVAGQNQSTMRSQAWNRTVAVIEAGIEEALAHLNRNASPDANGSFTGINLGVDGWTAVPGGWSKSNGIGQDYYLVTIKTFVPTVTNPDIITEGYVKQIPAYAMLGKFTPWLAQVTQGGDSIRGGYVKRQVVCATTNVPTFTKALVAKDGIDLTGQGVETDSFDSGKPNVASDVNGRYVVALRRDNGDIATTRGVTNTVAPIVIGNANIFGRVSTGPNVVNPGEALVALGPNGKVGGFAWQARGDTGGKIQPGWGKDDMNIDLPDITLPYTTATGPLKLNAANANKPYVIDGVTYDMYLENGNYLLQDSSLSGKIYVAGNACLVVPNGRSINMTGQDVLKIGPGASLKLYVDCASANIGGQGLVNPNYSTNFYYFGTKNNTSVSFSGNAEVTGVYYAPNAAISMNGGGSGDLDYCGAGVFRSIKMNGHYKFHYDEALRRGGLYRGYILTSWNEK